MRRFCDSRLLLIWSCSMILVLAFVLFDLLDIDGSSFQNPAEGITRAEEAVATKEAGKHFHTGVAAAWLPAMRHLSAAIRPLPTLPSRVVPLRRPSFAVGRPRAATAEHLPSSSQHDSEPARPVL